jgi:N-acetylglucosamine kinase-like BadF-type ATPase
MSIFLCVDSGASKTAAVIADHQGNIVGRGAAGPSNLAYLSADAYISAVEAAVAQALASASLPTNLPPTGPTPFAAAWFGISGADSVASINSVLIPLSTLTGIPPGSKLMVTNDTHLLAAPIRLYDDVSKAVAIISGTGSIAVSFKDVDGQLVECGRAGGWGRILGDEGSGYDVGREAIRQMLSRHDQASVQKEPLQPSTLQDKILSRFQITDVMEILKCVYFPDPPPGLVFGPDAPVTSLPLEKRISTLSPIVFEAAFEDNDPLARTVLKHCARALVDSASTVVGTPTEDKPRLVDSGSSVLSFGGSLVGVPKYREMILEGFKERGHVFKRVLFVDDAAQTGAVSLAAAYKKA